MSQLAKAKVLISTSESIKGRSVKRDRGLISSHTSYTRTFFHDLYTRGRSLIGGEVHTYDILVQRATKHVTGLLMEKALERGANAIVSYRIDMAVTSDPTAGVIYYASAYGTAVEVSPSQETTNERMSAD